MRQGWSLAYRDMESPGGQVGDSKLGCPYLMSPSCAGFLNMETPTALAGVSIAEQMSGG
jgi:hypothetical protein